ncbi:MAG: DUF1552 domain-containing protein [Archangium sp.]|nr:DUF1552 domain-containing protein [Archangium sp.]
MKIPRRHFLKGAGALLPIPLLTSLLPKTARAQVVAPRRILFFLQDNGTLRDEWTPTAGTGGLTLPYLLSPLEAVKGDILPIVGVDNHITHDHSGNAHDIGNGTLLTAIARSDFASVQSAANGGGPSIDQYLAGRLPTAPRRSININLPSGSFAVSYQAAAQPTTGLSLGNAFADLFGNFNGTTDPQLIAKRRVTRESVIDSVLENFRHVNTRVSAADKAKLDHHLTMLRDLETRLALEAQGNSCAPDPNPPVFAPNRPNNDYAAYLYALAFACQLSHVGSYMTAQPGSDPAFPVRFTGGDYHNWIHQGPDYGLDPVRRREEWRSTMRWYATAFAAWVQRFKATPDTDGGSLLDNTLIVWPNVFGMGSYHDFHEIPVVLAGRAGGAIQPGRLLDYRRARAANPTVFGPSYDRRSFVNETTNNLMVSLCHAMGLRDVTTFGDPAFCTGGLPGLVG